jgi:hypothetical protein
MKKKFLTVIQSLFILGSCYGQLSPKVGGNPYLIDASAAFEVQSTTKGLLYPRMSTTERDAIGAAATGLTIYNTTVGCLQWYRGPANGGWFNPCAAGSETGSGGTAVFKAFQVDAFIGQMVQNEAVSGVTVELVAVVETNGTYSLIASANGVTFSAAGTVTDAQVGDDRVIFLMASGTPQSGTTDSYVLNNSIPAFSFTASAIGTIASAVTNKIWMDRNLGASRQATSSTDHLAYGSLYQWGRRSDGHQIIDWNGNSATVNGKSAGDASNITSTKSDNPADAKFIISDSSSDDWRVNPNDALWAGYSGVNNPCPAGFRVPTAGEWLAETNVTSTGSAFTALRLVIAGYRQSGTGAANYAGSTSSYWSATARADGNATTRFMFWNGVDNRGFARGTGSSVRCLKD